MQTSVRQCSLARGTERQPSVTWVDMASLAVPPAVSAAPGLRAGVSFPANAHSPNAPACINSTPPPVRGAGGQRWQPDPLDLVAPTIMRARLA